MNLQTLAQIQAFGTAEGACKGVSTRGDKAAQQCGGGSPADNKPAPIGVISNWLDDKGLPTRYVQGTAERLANLGMSAKLMKFPFSVELNSEHILNVEGAVGIYSPDTKILSLNTNLAKPDDVVHEMTHWAMFSQMPKVRSHSQFLPDSDLSGIDSPEMKQDTQGMMKEFKKAQDKGIAEIRSERFEEKKDEPVKQFDFLYMNDKDVKKAGAPSGYALVHPAEWVAEAASEALSVGKRVQPATDKLVKNLWGGKYIQ